MSRLPKVKYIPLYVRNPRWHWWCFWRPRRVLGERAKHILRQNNDLLDDIVWIDKP